MAIALIEPGTPASQGILRLLGLLPEEDTALLELTETGVPLAQLALLTELGLTKTEIQVLIIPARTMSHRKAGTGRLNREESDRFLRVLRCLLQARQTFGDPGKAMRWLRKPKTGLNGRTPLTALETEMGARLVEEWLVRIDQGMAA
ncbi:conserved protein of unknown function [Acidithiobacillus ferrivorans]|uniref:Uncharacterized protein n=1 Tax=Acidithiobacillus ferrivorans TaxID=160808 RepID=A0A060UPE4_9PROT|nr:antitoxin Xre/MbcA/ParS toxin-binding domain-containing protein [Acidithiobacillus ferrivorans]CDQ10315.1 conserved hypothetical protein [Acidithiobacillus ferrivorans]SMH64342.1 conserved protein of unknown function [Acidithiobacillus ferrivorans]